MQCSLQGRPQKHCGNFASIAADKNHLSEPVKASFDFYPQISGAAKSHNVWSLFWREHCMPRTATSIYQTQLPLAQKEDLLSQALSHYRVVVVPPVVELFVVLPVVPSVVS